MLKTIIKLSSGTEISSGSLGSAVTSCKYTQTVNSGNDLALGSTCACMVELGLFLTDGISPIKEGDEITVYKDARQLGLFTCAKPKLKGGKRLTVTAYDRITWLDQDVSVWFASLTGWPLPLYQVAKLTIEHCGLSLLNTEMTNGSYMVRQFTAEGIKGRDIIRWAAEAGGYFCRATPTGEVEFARYTPAVGEIGATSEGGRLPIYQGTFTREDYATDLIDAVQVQFSAQDVGTIYPGFAGPKNIYRVTGNKLLSAGSAEELIPIARNLYEIAKTITYTPCKVTIPAGVISAGQTVKITDINGRAITALIMQRIMSGSRDTLESKGSRNRSSVTATNNQRFEALEGKFLNLETSVDRLRVENGNMSGDISSLELDLDGIRSSVSANEESVDGLRTAVTQLEQGSQGLGIKVQNIIDNGVDKVITSTGYRFEADGMHIEKSGDEMASIADNRGFRVLRSGEAVMTVDNTGADMENVRARKYLVAGTHARFEDYDDPDHGPGTGAFFL